MYLYYKLFSRRGGFPLVRVGGQLAGICAGDRWGCAATWLGQKVRSRSAGAGHGLAGICARGR